jgi:hypothetical protein
MYEEGTKQVEKTSKCFFQPLVAVAVVVAVALVVVAVFFSFAWFDL